MKSPVELLLTLMTSVKRLEPGVRGLDRDCLTIQKRFKDEGEGFLTIALPTLCDALERGFASGRFACPMGFARIPRGTIPRIFSGMFCKIFDPVTGIILEQPDVSVVTSLRQVTKLFKKMYQSDEKDDDLDRLAKMHFVEDDDYCEKSMKLDERQLFILNRVSKYILPTLDSFDEREVICKHGPGAVFEKLKPNQKWQALRTFSCALERLGFDSFYGSDTADGFDSGEQSSAYGASGSEARLISVAKNSTSRRTITIEPVVRQFVQQGFNAILRGAILADPVLSQSLDLKHQEQNQKLALEGSRTGCYATIDLKSASDKMSQDIINLVFRHKPLFLEWILDCRSPEVLVGDNRLKLRKYAGMGNATTFPVQSVVFAVLAICALVEDENPRYRNVKRAAGLVRVFGDDIIVPTDKVHQVVSWLTSAGLTVNIGKSFTTGNFRESCGVDAFMGVDVTPLLARYRPGDASRKDPRALAHYVSLANHAWLRGLYEMSIAIRAMVEKRLRRRLPYVRTDSGALGWHTHQQYSEIQRWNSELHRHEVSAPVIVNLKRADEIDGYAALLKFYHRPRQVRLGSLPDMPEEADVKNLLESPVRFRLKIVQRWVPA